MATTSGHWSRRVSLISSEPLGRMIVVLSLAMGVALVAFLASVSFSPTTSAYAATSSENRLVSQQLSITDLGTLGGPNSYAYGINDLGRSLAIAARLRVEITRYCGASELHTEGAASAPAIEAQEQ